MHPISSPPPSHSDSTCPFAQSRKDHNRRLFSTTFVRRRQLNWLLEECIINPLLRRPKLLLLRLRRKEVELPSVRYSLVRQRRCQMGTPTGEGTSIRTQEGRGRERERPRVQVEDKEEEQD